MQSTFDFPSIVTSKLSSNFLFSPFLSIACIKNDVSFPAITPSFIPSPEAVDFSLSAPLLTSKLNGEPITSIPATLTETKVIIFYFT
jgi:hypothetical protein